VKSVRDLFDRVTGVLGLSSTHKGIAHVPAPLIFHALCLLGVCEKGRRVKKASGGCHSQ
jgi:hypothetical protein